MNKPGSKFRKLVKLRKILRNKMVTKAVQYLTAMVFSMTAQGNTIESENLSGGVNDDKKIHLGEWQTDAAPSQLLGQEINFEDEIDARSDWFIEQYIDTLKSTLSEIKGISKYKPRKEYICTNFFDKVFEYGHRRDPRYYCIAAAMSCLSRTNDQNGDLDNFFPDSNSEMGNDMVYCPGFEKYVRKKYKGCVKEYKYIKGRGLVSKSGEVLDFKQLKKGSVLLQKSTENTSSGWHAVVYAGEGKIISFNNEGYYNVQKILDTKVIDLPEIIRKEWRERVKKMQLENANTPQGMIALLASLYAGRETEFMANFEGKKSAVDVFQFKPVALSWNVEPQLPNDTKIKEDMAKLINSKTVYSTELSPKKKTAIPWKIFSKIAGKNLES